MLLLERWENVFLWRVELSLENGLMVLLLGFVPDWTESPDWFDYESVEAFRASTAVGIQAASGKAKMPFISRLSFSFRVILLTCLKVSVCVIEQPFCELMFILQFVVFNRPASVLNLRLEFFLGGYAAVGGLHYI